MSVLVFATPAALRQAERLRPGRCLELDVQAAICAGRKRRRTLTGALLPDDQRFVVVDSNTGAILRREASPLTSRKAWRIVQLRRLRPRKRGS